MERFRYEKFVVAIADLFLARRFARLIRFAKFKQLYSADGPIFDIKLIEADD